MTKGGEGSWQALQRGTSSAGAQAPLRIELMFLACLASAVRSLYTYCFESKMEMLRRALPADTKHFFSNNDLFRRPQLVIPRGVFKSMSAVSNTWTEREKWLQDAHQSTLLCQPGRILQAVR